MYEYATGLIRVLEKRLPDKTDIDRMLLSKTAEESFNVLNDTDYAHLTEGKKPVQYNEIINAGFLELRDLLLNILDDEQRIFNFLFIEYNFLHIKRVLKELLLDIVIEEEEVSPQIQDPKDITEFITMIYKNLTEKDDAEEAKKLSKIKSPGKLSFELQESIEIILSEITKKKVITSKDIEQICDKELFRAKTKLAKKIGSRFVNDLIKLQIDFANTKFLLRFLEEYRGKRELTADDFINGGRIGIDRLLHIYKADKPVFFTNLKEAMEWYELSHIIERFRQNEKIPLLEKDLDQFEFNFIKTRAKSSSYGAAVVVGYFASKVQGIRNIRLIMSGKLNGVPEEDIKERLII